MGIKYSNIIFDLDGTLTDSAEGITRSVQYALSRHGITASEEDIKPFTGPPLHLSFMKEYGFSKKKAFQAVEHYRDYYRKKGIYENRLYPSVTKMLEAFSNNEAKLYIATSKPTVFAEKILKHFAIDNFFKVIAGSNLDGTRVEKEEVIGYVLNSSESVDKSKTVMIGDREHDIKGAHSWKLDSIAVTYGYGSLAELKAARPTYIVHSVEELSGLLLQ